MADPRTAVVLIAHGTVESLDDLPAFLTNIRRGHEAPADLVAEVRRRYEAIGGRSPLLDTTFALAGKLEARLGLPTRVAMRLWEPYPKDVVAKLAAEGVRRIVVVPLAQHSAAIYGAAVREAAAEVDAGIEVLAAPNWGRRPELTAAFVEQVAAAFGDVPADARGQTALVTTAHSLPIGIIRAGDPYEREFRGSAEDVAGALAGVTTGGVQFAEHVVAFQSQGIGAGNAWLGPDLRETLEALAARGRKYVVLAPIGFLADHVEILYDLDIEARAWARELGIVLFRSPSLNAGAGLVEALAAVARSVLSSTVGQDNGGA